MASNLSKRNIAHRLRDMARTAASPDFAAGLRAAADLLDNGEGADLHRCGLPKTGHYYECRSCRLKWYGFGKVDAQGVLSVEWTTLAGAKAAS